MTTRDPQAVNHPAPPRPVQLREPAGSPVMRSYLGSRDLPDAPVVKLLCRWIPPVVVNAHASQVLDMLIENPRFLALPVVDAAGRPCALIERYVFIEYFSRRYSIELYGKKPIAVLLQASSAINPKPIVVDASTSIDDVARIIIEGGMQHMVSGFVITSNDEYLGIANGHDLLNNIAQRKQEELYYLAHYDPLTKLPNRLLMADRLTMACRESKRSGSLVGLLFVDLDRFKQINDTLGHRFGDLLLEAMAVRLAGCVRGVDTVSRLGGDEFAVLLEHLADADAAEGSAQRIVDALQLPFSILGHELFVTASIGIAVYPRDDTDVETLFAKADAAMYEAKQSGRNGYRKYVPGLATTSMEQLSLDGDLRRSLERNELTLYFQPQIGMATDEVIGVEALVRWRHSTRGLVPPSVFIPIAEASGFIIDIGHWVLREACRQQRLWSLDHGLPLRMAINISFVQFRRPNFVDVVRSVIWETGVDPGCIELELTESIAMHRAPEVLRILQDLKRLGVKLAIDDFGTGFSSLSYLQQFPIDRLKIDQSFIRGIENQQANRSIVHAIAAMAKSLSLEVTAEGVETEAESAYARACTCDEVQGYLHSRPLPAGELLDWLERRSKAG